MILPTDLFPRNAVGAVAGLVGFGGAMGGVVFGQVVGYLLDHGFGYGVGLRHRRLAARPRLRRHLPGHPRDSARRHAAARSGTETCMKITEIRTRVVEWRGKTVPLPPHFCTNPMDLLLGLIHGAQTRWRTFTFPRLADRRGLHRQRPRRHRQRRAVAAT